MPDSTESNEDSSSHDAKRRKTGMTKFKKKARRYSQKYTTSWEQTHSWICKSKKLSMQFFCKVCNKDYAGGITEVNRHGSSQCHISNCKGIKRQPLIRDMAIFKRDNLQNKAREGELRIAAFIAEHNVPFAIADHLPGLIKSICTDSEIASNITCGRTKCTGIVKNVLGPINNNALLDYIKNHKFSLLVDESTDKGCTKHLALVVRFQLNGITRDQFLTLIPITNGQANSMFLLIIEYFSKNMIPYKDNMIGFAADGANSMMGVNHSLSTLLKDEIPNLFVFKCVCHSFALCASYACKHLPEGVESLVREIFKYFQYSNKKFAEFKEFQVFCDIKPHRLLHPAQTRWLSLIAVVNRVLEQWNPLKLFFTVEIVETKSESADLIYNKLKNVFNKLYLEFLAFILPYFTDLNKEMQSEKPKIHLLYSKVEAVYKSILEFFVQPGHLQRVPVHSVQYKDPQYMLPLDEIYLGGTVTAFLINDHGIPQNELKKFKLTCLNFYIECITQINARFSFKSKELKEMTAIAPENVLSKSTPSLAPLAINFPQVIKQNELNELDRQWRLLPNILPKDNITNRKNFEDFWIDVSNIKNGEDKPVFDLIMKLVNHIGVLPHSSAAVERVFSTINVNKTKLRNKLSTKTLIGMLHTKRLFANKQYCYNFLIRQEMTANMKTNIIYDHKHSIYTSSEEEKE